MQLPAAVSHQSVHYRSPEEQFHSFSTIEKEMYKLLNQLNQQHVCKTLFHLNY